MIPTEDVEWPPFTDDVLDIPDGGAVGDELVLDVIQIHNTHIGSSPEGNK